jgi:serine/threonine protein kinase
MAPEVARNRPYGKSVDVYSFGLLLWEVCSLEKPFAGYCSKKHMTNVILGGERPRMNHAHYLHWPMALQALIKNCWSSNPEIRPSFDVIKDVLEGILRELSIAQPERMRTRSTGSHDEASKNKAPLLPMKKINPLSSIGSLRARSLGLKRAQS